MPADQKPETERELGEIRREVIESRNLVIKTDNLLKNLHAELKMVGKRQEDFQKHQWISSGVAYLVFVALCITGAVLVSSASASSNTAEKQRLEKAVNELTSQLEKQKNEAAANASSARAAGEVYRMMTTLPGDERLKGIDALVKLDTARLTPLEKQALNDRSAILRKEIGSAAFERGKTAFRRNEFTNVISELSRFLAMNPEEQDMLDASFFLGTAYNQTRKHEQAVPLLQRFVSGDRRSKTRDYGMLLLAQSYEATAQYDRALETVRDALATYPNSEFAPSLKTRLSSIKRQISGVTDAANPQAAALAPPPAAPKPAAAAAVTPPAGGEAHNTPPKPPTGAPPQ